MKNSLRVSKILRPAILALLTVLAARPGEARADYALYRATLSMNSKAVKYQRSTKREEWTKTPGEFRILEMDGEKQLFRETRIPVVVRMHEIRTRGAGLSWGRVWGNELDFDVEGFKGKAYASLFSSHYLGVVQIMGIGRIGFVPVTLRNSEGVELKRNFYAGIRGPGVEGVDVILDTDDRDLVVEVTTPSGGTPEERRKRLADILDQKVN
jgi:hypothetical protein